MRRQLFSLAAAISLIACTAAAVVWVRSYFVGEIWHLKPTSRTDTTTSPWGTSDTWCFQYSLHSGRGRLQLVRREMQEGQSDAPGRAVVPPPQAISYLNGGGLASPPRFHTPWLWYLKQGKQYA